MNKQAFTKRGSTNFLRLVVLALGVIAVVLAILILPAVFRGWAQEYPDMANLRYPVLIILGATIIPFFAALLQTLKLLGHVDKNQAFSELSVTALGKIKYSALVFAGLYAVFLPIMYRIVQAEDAPGLLVINLVMVGAPLAIAVFAAVLQKLLHSAIAIKSENDLTV